MTSQRSHKDLCSRLSNREILTIIPQLKKGRAPDLDGIYTHVITENMKLGGDESPKGLNILLDGFTQPGAYSTCTSATHECMLYALMYLGYHLHVYQAPVIINKGSVDIPGSGKCITLCLNLLE